MENLRGADLRVSAGNTEQVMGGDSIIYSSDRFEKKSVAAKSRLLKTLTQEFSQLIFSLRCLKNLLLVYIMKSITTRGLYEVLINSSREKALIFNC